MKRTLLTVLLGIMVAGVPAFAHHSFAAEYFEDQSVSVEGDLVQFEYRSPHAWIHIMVKDENGDMQRFSAEWFSAQRLKQQGIEPDTLKVGDHFVITGSPGRKADEHRIHLKGIERPSDGWKWSGPGRGGPGAGGRGGPGRGGRGFGR